MRKLIEEKYGSKAQDVKVSSAGIYAFSGVEPPPPAVKAAQAFDIDLSTHRSRNIHLKMMEATDVVFCMTTQHKSHLVAKFPWFEERIYVLKEFALASPPPLDADEAELYDIEDPIGKGMEKYQEVYGEIKDHLEEVLRIWETESIYDMKMEKSYRIAIGSDHAGFDLKEDSKLFLIELGHKVEDFGTFNGSESVDYPDFAKPVAKAVAEGKVDYGLLVCGSGVGVCITANRFKKVRAALVTDTITARLSRAHDDANILCMGGRFVTPLVAHEIIKTFLETPFDGGRHEHRVNKIEK